MHDFARSDENISRATFLDVLQDQSTALIIGQPSPEALVRDLNEYVSKSEGSFYKTLNVCSDTVGNQLRQLFFENKFNPPSTTGSQLISDIALDISQFSNAIATPEVRLSVILQDRKDLQDSEVSLEPKDFESNELIDLVYNSGLVYHIDEANVNQIKVYGGPTTYCLAPRDVEGIVQVSRSALSESELEERYANHQNILAANLLAHFSKLSFYRCIKNSIEVHNSEIITTLDRLFGNLQEAQIGNLGIEGLELRPLQFAQGIGHLFFGGRQLAEAGYDTSKKCLFHARRIFTNSTENRRFLTIMECPEGYKLPLHFSDPN
jgi:hypothetical protein